MKNLILLSLFSMLCNTSGKFTKVKFLQIPELHKSLETTDNKEISFHNNELQDNEDDEQENNHAYTDEIITPEELEELRDAVSVLDDYDIYDSIYDPFSNLTRKKRSIGNDMSKYLSGIVDSFEKMIESKNNNDKKKYYNQAVDFLDEYISEVKSTRNLAQKNTLQIFKQEQYNLLLINCGGWLWYPIKNVKKIVRCTNGNLRFERRYLEKVRLCDGFVCKRVRI